MDSHYDVLGVDRTATPEQIKRAFRELALKYHPDQHPTPIANSLFRRIKEAYDVLSDPRKRAQYDRVMGFDGGQPKARAESTYCYYCGKRTATSAYRGRRTCASCIDAREAKEEAPRDAEESATPHSSEGPTRGQVSPPNNLRVGLYVAAIVIGVAIGIATANPLIGYVAISLGVVLVAAFASRLRTVLLLALGFFVVLPGGICGAVLLSEKLDKRERAALLREADDLIREMEEDRIDKVGPKTGNGYEVRKAVNRTAQQTPGYNKTTPSISNIQHLGRKAVDEATAGEEPEDEKVPSMPTLLDNPTATPNELESCIRKVSVSVKLRADTARYPVTWLRCKKENTGPLDAGLKQRPFDLLRVFVPDTGRPAMSFSSYGDPYAGGIQRIEVLDLRGDGTQQLLVEEEATGSGGFVQWCVVGIRGTTVGCWAVPNLDVRAKALLGPSEELRRSWRPAAIEGRKIRVEETVYARDDPNCCATRGGVVAELHAHPLRPALVVLKVERRP